MTMDLQMLRIYRLSTPDLVFGGYTQTKLPESSFAPIPILFERFRHQTNLVAKIGVQILGLI